MKRHPDTPHSVHRSKAQEYNEELRRTIKDVIDVTVALWPEAVIWFIEWRAHQIKVTVTFDGSCTCKDGLALLMQERLERMLPGKNIIVRANL